jgi:hypothetical protein
LGEDNYASFVLDYYANSYQGLANKKLYSYHFGRGFTGKNSRSLQDFRRISGLAIADDLIKDFLLKNGDKTPTSKQAYECARAHLIYYIVERWITEVAPEDKVEALRIILEHWEYTIVRDMMIEQNWEFLPILYSVCLEDACTNKANITMDQKAIDTIIQDSVDYSVGLYKPRIYRLVRALEIPLHSIRMLQKKLHNFKVRGRWGW